VPEYIWAETVVFANYPNQRRFIMYARVVTAQSKPGTLDEVAKIYETSIVPAMQKQPGFKGAKLMANANTNVGVSITFWETEADMLAGEASGYLQKEMAKLGPFFAAPPANAHYKVAVQV